MQIPELLNLSMHLCCVSYLTVKLITSVCIYVFQGLFDDVGDMAQNFHDPDNYVRGRLVRWPSKCILSFSYTV